MDPTTFEQVQAAIEVGQPGTFTMTADGFSAVVKTLDALSTEIPQAVNGVIGGGGSWGGPGATAFGKVADELVQFIDATKTSLQPYSGAITTAGDALTTAKAEIEAYAQTVAAMRQAAQSAGTTADEGAINAGALAILEKLANAYRTAGAALTPVPENPKQAADGGNDDGNPEDTPPGGDTPGAGTEDGDGPHTFLTSAPSTFAGDKFSSGNSPLISSSTLNLDGVPSFGLGVGGGNPTVLTSFTGTLETAPPIISPPPTLTSPGGGGGGPWSLLGFGAGGPGSTSDSRAISKFGASRSVLTSVGRLPGLGSDGYSQPPAETSTVRAGENPATWSRFGAGGGLAGRDARRERKTSLVGDEDWTDPSGVDGAIGRPAPPPAS